MTNARRARAALILAFGLSARSASGLDLTTALREAAAGSPELAARGAMIDAAQQRVSSSGGWNSPMVELGLVNVPTSGRFDQDPMTMRMIGIAQRVPIGGARGLARRSASANVAAETAAAELARYQVLAMTLESYAATRYAEERRQHAEAHQGVMQRLVEAARARYQSGRGRLEDVLRSEAERARLSTDIARFRAEVIAARARLDALRGVAVAGTDTLAPLALLPVAATPESWLAAAGPEHPRVQGPEARVQAYRLGAESARRMVWPDLELRGSYGFRADIVGAHGTEPQEDMFSVGVAFMLPLFAGSGELAEGREMEAMARSARAERRTAELELRREVTEAWAEAGAAERIVALLADTVVVAQRQAVAASWASYGAAGTDLWRVFESTHALYNENIALLRAREDLALAQARLLAATGRGDLLGIEMPGAGGSR